MAHIELFILNYNGGKFLDQCLQSILRLNLDQHTLEVSVVDNASKDNSKEVTSRYPGIHFIELNKNYGFSKGNNLGVKNRLKKLASEKRAVDYIAFLNNDTTVHTEWLKYAVNSLEKDPNIGILGSKSVFYDSYIHCEFECSSFFNPSHYGSSDTRDLGIYLSHRSHFTNIHQETNRTKRLGAYELDAHGGRWLKPKGEIFFAVTDNQKPSELSFVFDNGNQVPVTLTLTAGNSRKEITIEPGKSEELNFSISSSEYIEIIQNAGSFVTEDWLAGDSGCYTPEHSYPNKSQQVAAICGVSMFLPFSLFKKLHGFDETFFAYFEDTDLSLRARVLGKKCWYESRSKIRHVHCGSGGEFSPYFNFNVTFSHLIFSSRWMDTKSFCNKFLSVLKLAKKEFDVFSEDQNLETKPNLRTLLRCIKMPHILVRNRIFNLLHAGAIKKAKNSSFGALEDFPHFLDHQDLEQIP